MDTNTSIGEPAPAPEPGGKAGRLSFPALKRSRPVYYPMPVGEETDQPGLNSLRPPPPPPYRLPRSKTPI